MVIVRNALALAVLGLIIAGIMLAIFLVNLGADSLWSTLGIAAFADKEGLSAIVAMLAVYGVIAAVYMAAS